MPHAFWIHVFEYNQSLSESGEVFWFETIPGHNSHCPLCSLNQQWPGGFAKQAQTNPGQTLRE